VRLKIRQRRSSTDKLLADDIAKWAKVIQAANIKPE
jgi:hypothetical protein